MSSIDSRALDSRFTIDQLPPCQDGTTFFFFSGKYFYSINMASSISNAAMDKMICINDCLITAYRRVGLQLRIFVRLAAQEADAAHQRNEKKELSNKHCFEHKVSTGRARLFSCIQQFPFQYLREACLERSEEKPATKMVTSFFLRRA